MKNIVAEIQKEVIKRSKSDKNVHGYGAWQYHIKQVTKNAVWLAKQRGADQEIVELAALLHDIASVTKEEYKQEHHIHGAAIAEELLKKYNYPEDRIELIKKCILNHRGSRPQVKNTVEEVCVADADAMAHFDNLPSLFSLVYKEWQMSIDVGAKWIQEKLHRSFSKLSPQTQKLYQAKYDNTMSIFGSEQKK
jgi:uncharacterized protein